VRGNPAPSREAGQGIAVTVAGSLGVCVKGGDDLDRHGAHVVRAVTGEQSPYTPGIPDHTGTITANWHKGPGNTQVEEGCCIPVALHPTQDPISSPDVCHALGTGSATAAGLAGLAVRRLTPRECERLMGWPDDWTRYRADGTEIADSHRYRMCGNGVVAPVAEWIGRRLPR
jgi:site-specific DNA-cytosine methylase